MDETINKFKQRIDRLKKKVAGAKATDEPEITAEIKGVYIEIASSVKALAHLQEELRGIAQEYKQKKSSRKEIEKFYSFVKSKTSPALDVATLLDRAWNFICVEAYDDALKVLKRVTEIEPKNIRAQGLTGLVLMNQEHYDEAMLYFQKVLIVEPENPFALNNLGFICYKKGIWGEAIEHLSRAAKQEKDRTAALYANYYLGLVYFERSMFLDAIKFFEKAVKLGPNLQGAYYYLGLAETRRYEFKKAVGYFEKCIKIDPKSRYGHLSGKELQKIKPLTEPGSIINKEN